MLTTILRAYHGDHKIKAKYINRMRKHRAADDIIAGIYWEERNAGRFKGCAVGCTLHSGDHKAYEIELGIPIILARLEDRIFESMWSFDKHRARIWPETFLSAIEPNADLAMVWPKLAHWLLVDDKRGVIRHAKQGATKQAITRVAALYARWISGKKPAAAEFKAAASAASAAGQSDSYASYFASAYAAYAAYAAACAACAADYASADYASAAYSACASSVPEYDATITHYGILAEKLIELLKSS